MEASPTLAVRPADRTDRPEKPPVARTEKEALGMDIYSILFVHHIEPGMKIPALISWRERGACVGGECKGFLAKLLEAEKDGEGRIKMTKKLWKELTGTGIEDAALEELFGKPLTLGEIKQRLVIYQAYFAGVPSFYEFLNADVIVTVPWPPSQVGREVTEAILGKPGAVMGKKGPEFDKAKDYYNQLNQEIRQQAQAVRKYLRSQGIELKAEDKKNLANWMLLGRIVGDWTTALRNEEIEIGKIDLNDPVTRALIVQRYLRKYVQEGYLPDQDGLKMIESLTKESYTMSKWLGKEIPLNVDLSNDQVWAAFQELYQLYQSRETSARKKEAAYEKLLRASDLLPRKELSAATEDSVRPTFSIP